MRRLLTLFFVVLISGLLVSADETGIQLYVRVTDDATFVRSLKAADFEVTIGGTPQQAAALCQIEGSKIVQKEGKMKLGGELARHFTLVFFMKNYYPQLDKGIDHFFTKTLLPGDSLTIVTPQKTYNLKKEVLQSKPKQQLAGQLKGLLRRDIQMGSGEYKGMLKSLEDMVTDTSSISTYQLTQYEQTLTNLERLRANDQARIISVLAEQNKLKKIKGFFVLYEKELKPNLSTKTLGQIKMQYQDEIDLQAKLTSLFEVYNRDVRFDPKTLAPRFCQQGSVFHFAMFRNQFDGRPDVKMDEQAEDVFALFNELSIATGGMVETSGNPSAIFLNALSFFNDYYILDIPVREGGGKGKLKKVKIKIKGKKNYKVHHISGLK